jgi:hypothetical protein
VRALGRIALLGLLALLLTVTISAAAGAQVIGSVTGMLGSATVQRPGGVGPELLVLGAEVHQGDILRTGSGARLKLTLSDGSVLSLGADTEVKLDHLALAAPPREPGTLLILAGGYLRAIIGRLQPGSLFEIHSPSMVAAVRGTDWIESYSTGTTEIFVAEGRVLATSPVNQTDWALLDAGEGVSFRIGTPHTPVVRWGEEKIRRYVDATRLP